jgi:PAS domain S-box-containing protein
MFRSLKTRVLIGIISIVALTTTVLISLDSYYFKNRVQIDDISYNIQIIHNTILKLLHLENSSGSQPMYEDSYLSKKSKHEFLVRSITFQTKNLMEDANEVGIELKDDAEALLKELHTYDRLCKQLDKNKSEELPSGNKEMQEFEKEVYHQSQNLESIITGINTKLAFKKNKMYDSLRFNYLILILTTILLTIGATIVFSKSVTKPLFKLSQHISKVVESKFKMQDKLDMGSASIELQNINNQFHDLTQQLNLYINKQNKALEIIRTERIYYQQLADLLPLGIFETDSSGLIIYSNKNLQNKFLYGSDLSEKMNISDLVDCPSQTTIISEGNCVDTIEVVAKRKDGETFPALLSLNQILTGPYKGGFRGFVLDISERSKYIEALKREKIRAEESDRLKSAFLANVSHEIRTPLNGILGFSELLANTEDLSKKEKRDYATQINENSNLLLKIINDIIDFAKIESGKIEMLKQVVDVDRLMREVYEHFKHMVKSSKPSLALNILSKTDQRILIISDKQRLQQVLINLIGNAIKFTDIGSVDITYALTGNHLVVEVKDSGIGIPIEKREIIFERFRQADESISRQFGGTGLGLSISKQIVELLNGTITVESEVGKGSEFIVDIPVIQAEETSQKMGAEIRKSFNFQECTILIAEDDQASYNLLEALLRQTGAQILHALNGEEAVRMFGQNPNTDLILMDINMPLVNGVDAIKMIRETNKQVPIIIQSASAIQTSIDQAWRAGCSDYVTKPINIERLLDKINFFLIQTKKVAKIDIDFPYN